MRAAKAAVPRHTPPREYPSFTGKVASDHKACVDASKTFTASTLEWLKKRNPTEQAAWLKGTVEEGRVLFQPWSLEILFVLGTFGRQRFSEVQSLLGVSSRTLSDKLQMLRREGFIDREVVDETPIRVEYFLTKHGRIAALLASPLICELNRRGGEAYARSAGEAPR